MSKAKSLFKKIKSISKNGFTPIQEGKNNFENPKEDVERKAQARAKACDTCENKTHEPIDVFRIYDPRIKEISNKMCGEDSGCGCALPYLLRQDKKICTKW